MTTTELALDDLRRILAHFDLRPSSVERFEKGTINSNFRVETNGGRVFVRVNEGKREFDVRYEGALLWHLGARRFPTPPPLRTSAGEPFVRDGGKLITVFPWWPGREIVVEGEGGEMTAERAQRVGEVLARMHVLAAEFPLRREGIYTFERICERVAGFRGRADLPAIAEVLPLLDEEIAFLTAELPRLSKLPSGTIHGDLFPDNLLWAPARRRRKESVTEEVSAVLDFEQASIGRFSYDLALTLLAWCWQVRPSLGGGADEPAGRLDPALAWAMIAGYQRARPLGDDERDALLVEARTAALRFTVTRITDIYLPSLADAARPPRPGKDFRDYVARLRFLRAEGREALGLAAGQRPPLRSV